MGLYQPNGIHPASFLRDSLIRDGIFPVLNIFRKIRDASTELFQLRDLLNIFLLRDAAYKCYSVFSALGSKLYANPVYRNSLYMYRNICQNCSFKSSWCVSTWIFTTELRDALRDLSTEHFRIFKGFPVLNVFLKSLINDTACILI